MFALLSIEISHEFRMKSVTKGNKYKRLIVCMSLEEELPLHSDDIFARQRTAVVRSIANLSCCRRMNISLPQRIMGLTPNFQSILTRICSLSYLRVGKLHKTPPGDC